MAVAARAEWKGYIRFGEVTSAARNLRVMAAACSSSHAAISCCNIVSQTRLASIAGILGRGDEDLVAYDFHLLERVAGERPLPCP
ncbi:hypothetical protein ILFOPFJJ_06844 [Ensifer psoraleae]|nr:hypothetical protein [Sinorhizobium psoraleae]